jgi:sialate O-acetylesterase
MKKFLFFTMLGICMIPGIISANSLWLPSIFSDNMVLQQQTEVPFWGKSSPSAKIMISTSWGVKATATADEKGKWKVEVKTPKAGGPYAITITGDGITKQISNILIGEVWICSGQSNMEMPLAGWPPRDTILGSYKEISTANNPNLRTFTVKKAYSIAPIDTCNGDWVAFNPQTAGSYSATAYFFGKKLYETLKVPIGLIHTSWGGTPAEAWTTQEALKNFPEYSEFLSKVNSVKDEYDALCNWIKNHPRVNFTTKNDNNRWKDLDLKDSQCSYATFDDSKWGDMELPGLWEQSKLGEFDGIVWFRKEIEIPKTWEGKDLELSVAMADDMDATYFNGTKVGGYEAPGFWQTPRKYVVPSQLVKAGKAVIAVRVIDTQGGGGIWGNADQMYIKPVGSNEIIKIAGTWKYLPVGELLSDVIYIYGVNNKEFFSRPKISIVPGPYLPSVLYNAMVSPLVPYSVRGAIWYQGEANVGRATQYVKLFPAMIQSWRTVWNQPDMPFYYVQIAPYEYSGADSDESAWLRDAQRRSLTLNNTGMAVTLDVATVKNIHPPYKKEVGERLALWALANTYQQKIECSGPLFQKAEANGDHLIVTFSHVGKGLLLKTASPKEFEIAGADGKFVPASVKIENNKLIVWNAAVKNPVNVRYAFKNGSQAELFNVDGLPASSFTSENIKK